MYKIIAGSWKLFSPHMNLLDTTPAWAEVSFKEKKIYFLHEIKLLHYIP